ncbi:MAG: arginine N-succinyltransferase [Pseudomonadota bacterium]
MIVRPAEERDIDGLHALAQTAGTGMTTVPATREAIEERVQQSIGAISHTDRAGPSDIFFFVLDVDGDVQGMASIFPALGEDRPFYSYRVSKVAAAAPELGIQAASDLLYLCNDFHGYTEIGTLLISKEMRGTGAGRLLSLSRFLFMDTIKERLAEKVMAEIRGQFRDDGTSAFWDSIASRFFQMTFDEADHRSKHDFRFIADLMPKFPIYTALLPEECRNIIAKAHPTSAAAMNMLKNEGFQYTGCIDIFDGGPSLETPLSAVRTVRESIPSVVRIQANIPTEGERTTLVAVPNQGKFKATLLPRGHRDGSLFLTPQEAERLDVKSGDAILTSPLKTRRR